MDMNLTLADFLKFPNRVEQLKFTSCVFNWHPQLQQWTVLSMNGQIELDFLNLSHKNKSPEENLQGHLFY